MIQVGRSSIDAAQPETCFYSRRERSSCQVVMSHGCTRLLMVSLIQFFAQDWLSANKLNSRIGRHTNTEMYSIESLLQSDLTTVGVNAESGIASFPIVVTSAFARSEPFGTVAWTGGSKCRRIL